MMRFVGDLDRLDFALPRAMIHALSMMTAALMMLLGGAGLAMGQDGAPAIDESAVEACLADAVDDQSPLCLGAQVKACTAASPEGDTTIGMTSCIQAETKAWDDLLNREYTALRDLWSDRPAVIDRLTQAQRAWIAFRDADCALTYERWDGGSIRSVAAANCQMVATARRAMQLHNMRPQ